MSIFVLAWLLYILTSAPGTVYGDPSEYQFIPAVWGIAHPPGYAFYTLLAGVWQRLFPVGSIAFRTNLLSGAAAAWASSRVFLIISSILRKRSNAAQFLTKFVALLVTFAFVISPDVWQHAIHANAHIVSLALTSTQLWLLLRWSEKMNSIWLYIFAFFCGIGVTHHPITIWGLPAYAVFILITRPKFIKEPKLIIPFITFGIMGLAPLLYYVIRSPNVPFGPTDMRTWAGFIRHATAQGLRVNLFHYGLSDQIERWSVFISLLRLQYAVPFLLCLAIGCYIIVKKKINEGFLIILFVVGHLTFTLNSVQDVMAYLLHIFMALTIPIAIGCAYIFEWWHNRSTRLGYTLAVTAMLLLLVVQLVTRFPVISLRYWREADNTFSDLVKRFQGRAGEAAYVSDWEHLTPYYYHTLVEGVSFNPDDLRPVYVTAGLSWDQAVFANLPLGPVYLTNYRREIRDLGFRLRPIGDLWQVLEPPAVEPVSPQFPLDAVALDASIKIIGYDLPEHLVVPGDVIPLTIYATTHFTQVDILMPFVTFGPVEQRWTTDSRRLTPEWLPGEIIVEKFYVYVPHIFDAGTYPITLQYANLTKDSKPLMFVNGSSQINIGDIIVQPASGVAQQESILDRSLTVIGNDISLMNARARVGLQNRNGVWTDPLVLKHNRTIHLNLTWLALKHPQMSYTVYIHLIDSNNVPVYGHDYTPLGGAFPTYLWFPKWLPGQQVNDPYKLKIPSEVPPEMYWLEIGMYEMGSIRRIPLLDKSGSMTGDRLILGPVLVESVDS